MAAARLTSVKQPVAMLLANLILESMDVVVYLSRCISHSEICYCENCCGEVRPLRRKTGGSD